MKKDDACAQIKQEYRRYKKQSGAKVNPVEFYGWLQQNRSDLLTFRCSGSKYQEVAIWVNQVDSQPF